MTVCRIEQTSSGIYKLTPDAGSAFFLRDAYLETAEARELLSLMTGRLSPEPESPADGTLADILQASLVYSCECVAMRYLSRAEQCRASLSRKLGAKGLDKAAVARSLDFLEENGILDDFRFAGAWLRNRSIDHAEGRTRQEAELCSRGVRRDAVKKALDEFWADEDPGAVCARAVEKLVRKKTPAEKLYGSLVRLGFPASVIKDVLGSGLS